jgi:RNA polymerase primary sigma factor
MYTTLEDWESSFEPFFQDIQLIGEIPITYIQIEDISKLISGLIKSLGPNEATRILESNFPHTFVVFLSLKAAHNTFRDYWGVIAEAVGLSKQRITQLEWGPLFIKLLQKYSLPTFSIAGGYRYVTPIRLHGGIPAYSLPDYFAYIIFPIIKDIKYSTLSISEAVDILIKSSSTKFRVDSTVVNFLEYGGDYAVEFVDHCRSMAIKYNQSGEIPDAKEIELPPYVVRSYKLFVEEELETDKGQRLRSPRLYLDPYEPEFFLFFPSEPVNGLMVNKYYFWKVSMQDKNRKFSTIERVKVRRRGYDIETFEEEISLNILSQEIIIAYCFTDSIEEQVNEDSIQTIRRWRLSLLPEDNQPPLIVFRSSNRYFLRWNQTIPAEELWLMTPIDVNIEIQGEGRIIEEFPNFFGAWGNWTIQSWDLSKAYSIQLTRNEKRIKSPIPVINSESKPILFGDNQFIGSIDPDNVPLFVGSPPRIKIPISPGRNLEPELNRWNVTINSRWSANPVMINSKHLLSDYISDVKYLSNAFEFPLECILGRACGTYSVSLAGPGDRLELKFRVWRKLEIEGLHPYYLPTEKGAQEVHFKIRIPKECDITTQAGTEGIRIKQKEDYFHAIIDPEITKADFHLIAPLENDEPVRLPVSIDIPRLRWALQIKEDDTELNWQSFPIKENVARFIQSDLVIFYLDLPLVEELPLIFNIVLINPENGEILQHHSKQMEVRKHQTRWRFIMSEFFDTLNYYDEQPIFEFLLRIGNIQTNEVIKVPVLRLSRTLDIKIVWIEFIDKTSFRLWWEEQKPLRNRRVRIWSEWQPWIKPLEIEIPDSAEGEFIVKDVALPPSHYRLNFFTAAPWDPKEPPLDPHEDSLHLETENVDDHLKAIYKRLNDNNKNFRLHFESACVYHTKNDIPSRDEEIQWCCQNILNCKTNMLFSLHRWLGKIDKNTQKAVRIKMFKPENLKELFVVYKNKNDELEDFLEYFPDTNDILPESALFILEKSDNPAIVMHALKILVKKNHSDALEEMYKAMKTGSLSDQDTIELLLLDTEFTLPRLCGMRDKNITNRIVQEVVKLLPEQKTIVTKGYWARTNAGWGKIVRIWDQLDNIEIFYFDRNKTKPILTVILRPDDEPEEIEVDLESNIIKFIDAREVKICTKCYNFASKNTDILTKNKHKCGVYNGIGASYRPSTASFKLKNSIIFSINPPEDQFS